MGRERHSVLVREAVTEWKPSQRVYSETFDAWELEDPRSEFFATIPLSLEQKRRERWVDRAVKELYSNPSEKAKQWVKRTAFLQKRKDLWELKRELQRVFNAA